MIPIDDGNNHIILASLYNPSGAGFDPVQQEQSEALAAAATTRMMQFPNTPHFIGTDFNQDPDVSHIISAARENNLIQDLARDWALHDILPRTFQRGGIS